MKLRSTLLALALVTTVGFANAQDNDAAKIKILPGAKRGMVTVLYAMEVKNPVEVQFTTADGVIKTDRINGEFPKGLMKKYDISKIGTKSFWVEVSSGPVSVTYRVTASGDKYIPTLEHSSHNYGTIARNN